MLIPLGPDCQKKRPKSWKRVKGKENIEERIVMN